jgi:cytochrome P450
VGDLARTTALRESREQDGILEPLIDQNPPRHTRLRRTMMPSYTNARVLDYREEIESAVAEYLNAMERSGPPVDLVSSFAEPVVTAAHAAVFGISREDCARLVEQSAKPKDATVPVDEAIASSRETAAWIHDLLEKKRAHPADDVMSALANSDLSPDEAVSQAVDLANSGHDTVIGMIANSAFVLLCHPDQLRAVQRDPSLMEGAIDECMRYFTLVRASFTRIAREDLEVAGRLIRAGECITVSIAAANRDPSRFDEPERFDVTRNARGHLGFGHGIHVCLGKHLARMEMRVALGALIERFPTLQLNSSPEEVELSAPSHVLHFVKKIRVAW